MRIWSALREAFMCVCLCLCVRARARDIRVLLYNSEYYITCIVNNIRVHAHAACFF